MEFLNSVLFLWIWLIIWVILVYTRAYFKYENKWKIDQCYSERKQLKEEKQKLEHELKESKENIKSLKKELESAYREIAEKNKYLSEDKVIVERLYEVKKLSDKISWILIDYDKDMIQQLLKEYEKWENKKNGEEKKW